MSRVVRNGRWRVAIVLGAALAVVAQFHKLPAKVTVSQVGKSRLISTRKLTIQPRKRKHYAP